MLLLARVLVAVGRAPPRLAQPVLALALGLHAFSPAVRLGLALSLGGGGRRLEPVATSRRLLNPRRLASVRTRYPQKHKIPPNCHLIVGDCSSATATSSVRARATVPAARAAIRSASDGRAFFSSTAACSSSAACARAQDVLAVACAHGQVDHTNFHH